MIKEAEVIEILEKELPGIQVELKKGNNAQTVYTVVQCFAGFTKNLAGKGDLKEVGHCFCIAEKMLREGSYKVKNAVENVYVFSISSLLDITSPINNKVKTMMNGELRKEYYRQVSACGM